MNVYKFYFSHLIRAVEEFKSDFKYSFIVEDILKKLTLEPPKNSINGDMSTNLAMILSKDLKLSPKIIANNFMVYVSNFPDVEDVNVAGPGFINITFKQHIWADFISDLLQNPENWDKLEIGKGKNINIEYISANPTGPLHAGHARGAVFGDTLASLLTEVGYSVTREYYINDAGNQIEKLVESSLLRYNEQLKNHSIKIPDGLYPGEYLKEVGEILYEKYGDKLESDDKEKVFEKVRSISLEVIMGMIKNDLLKLGIEMDIFTSEKEIISGNLLDEILKILESKKLIYNGVLDPPKGTDPNNWEKREQLLFKSSEFDDDSDRALKKSDGTWTYFATDMAYHLDKINRTKGDLINVLGADHIGYISRINAAVSALSNGSISIDTKVCALVNLLEDGKPIKMSKRSGNFVTLSDILNAVGKDVVRFIMLTRRNDQSLDFDFKKVMEKSKENPVFYVQYAHARCNSIFRSLNIKEEHLILKKPKLLKDDNEIELIKFIALWPRTLEIAAKNHEPHRICYYLIELSSIFHSLWNKGKENNIKFIVKDDLELTNARLSLVKAVALTIRKGLSILKIKPIFEM